MPELARWRNTLRILYNDFFMPSRLDEYAELLRTAVHHGYTFWSLREYACHLKSADWLPERVFLLRHDIDSDVATAKQIFAIEQEINVKSSYYFRLSTIDVPFMLAIEKNGSEASYHFEEIATVAKRHGIKAPAEIDAHLEGIRALFRANLIDLRRRTGLPMATVAAHGDFLNRRLGLLNQYLLNEELRSDLGILAEAYDRALAKPVVAEFFDGPLNWRPSSPVPAIEAGMAVIAVLVHPRWWQRNIRANAREWGVRVGDGLRYWVKRQTRAGVAHQK